MNLRFSPKQIVTVWLLTSLTAFALFVLSIIAKPYDAYVKVPAKLTYQGVSSDIKLPFYPQDKPAGIYYLAFQTPPFPKSDFSGVFRIVGDNCIESLVINDTLVDLSQKIAGDRCDFNAGVFIDLKPYMIEGANQFWVSINNHGGGFRFEMMAERQHVVDFAFWLFAFTLLLPGVLIGAYATWRCVRPSWMEVCLWTLANLVFLFWITHTGTGWFANDYGGHMDYIQYIASELRLPHPRQGWVFYHPPLFYSIAGSLAFVAKVLFPTITEPQYLRSLSLLCINAFMIASILTLRELSLPKRWYVFALVLVFFWPIGLISSGRVDSNVMLYAWMALGFLMTFRWHRTGHVPYFVWALVFLGLGLATRTNAAVLAPVLVLACALRLRSMRDLHMLALHRGVWIGLVVVMLGAAVNTGRIVYYRMHDHTQQRLVIGNADYLSGHLFVDTTAREFLTFDLAHYVDMPFTHGPKEFSSNFWHVLFKTSAFGEFDFWSPLLGYALSVSVLIVWVMALMPLLLYQPRHLQGKELWIAWVLAGIVALIANRLSVPAWPSGDFRYIYFILPAVVVLYIRHTRALLDRGYVVGGGLALLGGALTPLLSLWLVLGEIL